MAQWMEDLKAAALTQGPAASRAALRRAGELPPSLSELCAAMNGAALLGGVELFALEALVFEARWICFGRKGQDTDFFAVRCADVFGLAHGGALPAWVEAIEPDAWVFVAKGAGGVQVYSTLERLLAVKVPPPAPPSSEFGEHSFARALATVREAIVALRYPRVPKAVSTAASKPRRTEAARKGAKTGTTKIGTKTGTAKSASKKSAGKSALKKSGAKSGSAKARSPK